MSRRTLAAGLSLVLLLAGCSAIDPGTTQLERFKELGAARRYAAIEGEGVRCVEAETPAASSI